MLEKRLDNTIFLMYLVTEYYCKAHNLTTEQFLELDKKYLILNYVSECPDVFDSMTDYVEANKYLFEAYDKESSEGKDGLYSYINVVF